MINEYLFYELFPDAREVVAKKGFPNTIFVGPDLFDIYSPFLAIIGFPIIKAFWIDKNTYVLDWNVRERKKDKGLGIEGLYFDEAKILEGQSPPVVLKEAARLLDISSFRRDAGWGSGSNSRLQFWEEEIKRILSGN